MCLPSLSMERTVTGSRFKISVVQNWTGHLENVNDWQDLLHEIYWGTAGAKAWWHHGFSCQQLQPILEQEPILKSWLIWIYIQSGPVVRLWPTIAPAAGWRVVMQV